MMADLSYDFAYSPYERAFIRPLKTHHGEWAIRQGIFVFLRHQDSGKIGVGEIAPLPWFGTETMEAAIAFCSSLPKRLSFSNIVDIPNQLPCTQFGIGTALEATQNLLKPERLHQINIENICGLLPAGQQALVAWEPLWKKGHRTFKLKIGVASIEHELSELQILVDALPTTAKLRLDANGGLTLAQARQWCVECDWIQSMPAAPTIEYLEQPLPPDQWRSLQVLASSYQTPIALDESVATLVDLDLWIAREWSGYYVMKPLIMGFPWSIRQSCDQVENPKVFSSVFEAEIGRKAALVLAQDCGTPSCALGFGVDHWLAESPRVSISSSIFA